MPTSPLTLALTLIATLVTVPAAAQTAQHPHTPLTARGEHAMGFDQHATVHHFYLYEDGGAIDVAVKDPHDQTNLTAIRSHLPHIVQMFRAGDFSIPHFIHADNVPGSATMSQRRDQIVYIYEERPQGGRVRMTTRDAAALAAIHEFMRYQITDHQTGDSLAITREP